MATLDEVYQKFDEAAEAAQLLETEIGNMLMLTSCLDEGLLENQSPARAAEIRESINRHTLGQLLKCLNCRTQSLDALDTISMAALSAPHSAYSEYMKLPHPRLFSPPDS